MTLSRIFSSPVHGGGGPRSGGGGGRYRRVLSPAPSTMLRMVPLPRFAGKERVLAALAAVFLGLTPAAAQEATPTPTAALPAAPIPYTTIRPPRPKAARPAPRPAAAATPAPAPAPAIAQPLAAAAPLPPAELEAFVDGVVRQAMASDHIAGATVAVVQNGQVVLKKGYGFAAPSRPVDPDRTLFRIGSISKTFTWITLLNEIDAGRMRLDAPVNLYLPLKVQVRDQGFDQPVTLRHLMSHTPGFEDRALGHLFERDYDRVRPLLTYLRQERPQRVRAPGTLPSYSNYGAALAGAAVSNVTGKTFEALAEQEIINPLGLTRTTFREPHPVREGTPAPMSPALARNLSEGFRWTPEGYRERPFEYIGQIAPAGAASSTAADMARYMNLLLAGGTLDGTTVFSPRVAEWMRTSLYRPAPGAAGATQGLQDLTMPGGRRALGHAGETLSFHSNMILVPDLGLGVFVSTNTDTGHLLARDLPAAVVERFYAPAARVPPAGSKALLANRGAYEGMYLDARRAHGGLEAFVGALRGFVRVSVTPDGYLSIGDARGPRLWAATADPAVFRRVDGPETLVFQVEGGRAVRFFSPWGYSAFERRGDFAGPGLLSLLAALTAIASIATLIGLAMRDRRDFRETNIQGRASLLQTTQSILWLLGLFGFAVWASGTGDAANVVFNWPGGWMVLASACCLVAAVLTLITVMMLPVIWRGGRRVDSWTIGRKLRFTATAAIFVLFAVDLGYWGALFPWSG